jgi:hypothetical protein
MVRRVRRIQPRNILLCVALISMLAACGGPDTVENVPATGDSSTPPASTQNSAPVIAGSPAASVRAGSAFAFTPTASDADGDTLTFSISGAPAWASFNAQTGG